MQNMQSMQMQAGSRSLGAPSAPLLSNLGLPRRADSKLQSLGIGSLDILHHNADCDLGSGGRGGWTGRQAGGYRCSGSCLIYDTLQPRLAAASTHCFALQWAT